MNISPVNVRQRLNLFYHSVVDGVGVVQGFASLYIDVQVNHQLGPGVFGHGVMDTQHPRNRFGGPDDFLADLFGSSCAGEETKVLTTGFKSGLEKSSPPRGNLR